MLIFLSPLLSHENHLLFCGSSWGLLLRSVLRQNWSSINFLRNFLLEFFTQSAFICASSQVDSGGPPNKNEFCAPWELVDLRACLIFISELHPFCTFNTWENSWLRPEFLYHLSSTASMTTMDARIWGKLRFRLRGSFTPRHWFKEKGSEIDIGLHPFLGLSLPQRRHTR